MHRSKSSSLINEDLNLIDKIERKQFENICESCSKLIQLCNRKELKVADIKCQPHYTTVLKLLKSQLEHIIASDSSKMLDKLSTISHLIYLKNNIIKLLNYLHKFVIDNGSSIGTPNHHLRRSFFVKIVHFQFLCHEIEAYFPGGVYTPSRVTLSKHPAKTWWDNKFGDKTFVILDIFVNKFNEDYHFANEAEVFSFRNSINFTSTNFTTKFEFDLFTRLYSPWELIYETWRILYNHPAYLHLSTYGDTRDILNRHINKAGTYVFRVSCKDLGFWTIGYVKGDKETAQTKVDKTNLIDALVEGQQKHQYLYPNGEPSDVDLSNLIGFRKEIIVNNEDIQLYDCFEDFKECKICRSNEKDLQLENCGHQICQGCLKLMRKFDKKLCPFCNQKILSTTNIVHIKENKEPCIDAVDDERGSISSDEFMSFDLIDSGRRDGDSTRPSNIAPEVIFQNESSTSSDSHSIESPTSVSQSGPPLPLLPPKIQPVIPPKSFSTKDFIKRVTNTNGLPRATLPESESPHFNDSAWHSDLRPTQEEDLISIGSNSSKKSIFGVVLKTADVDCHVPRRSSSNNSNGELKDDEIFSKWKQWDICRALRVARNDKWLARDILEEFVPLR